MSNLGIRFAAGAIAAGLALAGPGMTGLALADSPDDGASAASTDPRAAATRPATSRASGPARESRAERTPRAASAAASVPQARAQEIPAGAAEAIAPDTTDAVSEPVEPTPLLLIDLPAEDPAGSGDSADDPVDVVVDVPVVTDPGAPGEPEWAYYTALPGAPGDLAELTAPVVPAASDRVGRVPTAMLADPLTKALQGVGQFLDGVIGWLSTLPANPVTDFVAGALLLVRRLLPDTPDYGATQIVIPELDTRDSKLGVRVNPNQDSADGIKTNVSAKPFALTLPGPASNYTVTANKPELVTVSSAGNQINITPTTPGFLGLKIAPKDGSDPRYLGLYIGDQTTGIVPDVTTVNGKPPLGTVALTNGTGDKFLESFNYRTGVAPIDYL
ncbi:MAG: hypothetical protein ACKOB8_12475, partial [Mycobacterium sp.]